MPRAGTAPQRISSHSEQLGYEDAALRSTDVPTHAFRRRLDERTMLIGSLYLRDPPLDVVIDLLASAGAVLLVSLSLVTRRGLCLCSA